MNKKERRELVSIGRQLGTLNKEDIDFILDTTHSEKEVNQRMVTARQRTQNEEMKKQAEAATPLFVPFFSF